jgi:aliphatic nitrilase
MKLRHDFAGHYNRPDIFHLQINRAAPKLYSVHGSERQGLPDAAAAALGAPPSALLASPSAGAPDEPCSIDKLDDSAAHKS